MGGAIAMKQDGMLNKKIVLLLISFLIPMSGVGIDIYVPSLPSISHGLNAGHGIVTEILDILSKGKKCDSILRVANARCCST